MKVYLIAGSDLIFETYEDAYKFQEYNNRRCRKAEYLEGWVYEEDILEYNLTTFDEYLKKENEK